MTTYYNWANSSFRRSWHSPLWYVAAIRLCSFCSFWCYSDTSFCNQISLAWRTSFISSFTSPSSACDAYISLIRFPISGSIYSSTLPDLMVSFSREWVYLPCSLCSCIFEDLVCGHSSQCIICQIAHKFVWGFSSIFLLLLPLFSQIVFKSFLYVSVY